MRPELGLHKSCTLARTAPIRYMDELQVQQLGNLSLQNFSRGDSPPAFGTPVFLEPISELGPHHRSIQSIGCGIGGVGRSGSPGSVSELFRISAAEGGSNCSCCKATQQL
eukprot:18069-Heterococcus_DN1.PRE.3